MIFSKDLVRIEIVRGLQESLIEITRKFTEVGIFNQAHNSLLIIRSYTKHERSQFIDIYSRFLSSKFKHSTMNKIKINSGYC